MQEVWKDIESYEGCYQISNLGRVKSLGRYKNNPQGMRTYWVEERILRPQTNIHGYIYYCLKKDGDRKNHTGHRLVASAFLPNPDNLPLINHKDESRNNNHVDNLEWCTHQYNTNYGNSQQRKVSSVDWAKFVANFPWGERAKKQYKKITQMTKDGNFVRSWESQKSAGESLGIPSGNICRCCKGELKTAGGFVWKYAEEVV